jgi:hypothetical protein
MLMQHVYRYTFRGLSALFLIAAACGQALADPPSRVARLSYIGGDVSMRAAGIDEWTEARINRPLISGDNLYTDRASRVEMEIGAATLRLDERTSFGLLDLNDEIAQVELTAGTLNLDVRRLFEGQSYEIDTPTLALVISEPGVYRVDIAPDASSTMVSVVRGSGDVYGSDNASFRIGDGYSYRFYDTGLRDYETLDLPRQDDFDRWCYERTERYERSPSRRYVSEEVIGYADLDTYGTWNTSSSYGAVWYPSRVAVDWAPYRHGHWSWIHPWGWTWVDDAPWGFAPFHYGRWAYIGSRWGWIPGPRNVRPVYAPALVAFVGGGGFSVSISSGGPVGWFPLGPRDVYVPWYRGSRDYFNRVNVHNTTIINNTYITNVYNDYSRGRPITNFNYAYRGNDRAFTAVSHDAFINARAVERSRVQVDRALLSRSQVVSRVEMTPTRRSFVGGSAARGGGRAVGGETFQRQVVARKAPPMREISARERIQAIARNDNQPLAADQVRELRARKPASESPRAQRIQVVGNDRAASKPQALPSRAAAPDRKPAVRDNSDRTPVRGNAPNRTVERADTQRKPQVREQAGDVRGAPTRVEPADRRPAVERKPATRDADNRTKPTVRAPSRTERSGKQPQRIERGTPPSAQERNARQDSDARNVRPPVQRKDPVRQTDSAAESRQRANEARQQEQRREMDARQRAQQQREAQQERYQQHSTPEPRREVQPRQAPEPRREVQPRQAPQPRVAPQQRAEPPRQQRQERAPQPRQQPNPPARKENSRKQSEDKDDSDKDQRKRRD